MLRPVIPARWCVLLAEIAIRGFSQSTVTAPRAFAANSDSVATALMTRVIARRRASLAAISGRSYQSLVKLAAENPAAPPDSARSVLLLTAVHSRIYWEGPDRYQETVDARHRAADGGIGRAPATVDEIAHFERETVDLQEGGDASRIGGRSGGHASRGDREQVHYSLRSPVARDALQQYTYAIVDTFTVEGRHIDRLSVTPIEGDRPSFTGTIDVADSTGDLLAMDLGVNAATAFATITDLRYVELLRDAGGGWWLPYDIRLTGEVHRKISASWLPRTMAGMAVPEFPRAVTFAETASLTEFEVTPAPRPSDLAEYRAILDERADGADSGMLADSAAMALTPAERAAWAAGDSAERHPGFIARMARDVDAVQRNAFGPGAYHFNRVDGLYVGAAHDWRLAAPLTFTTRLGYALGREAWQYRVGGRVLLSDPQQLWVGASYHDETVAWPSLIAGGYDAAVAFVSHVDPNDYFRDRGFALSAGSKLLDFTRLELRYDDARQTTLDTLPGLGFHSSRFPPLPNPPIRDGHLRAVSGIVSYDSRQLVRSRGVDSRLGAENWTRVSLGVEVSAHDVLASDFSFQRYSVQIERQQRWGRMGSMMVTIAGGVATHFAPPQQDFTIGYGSRLFAAEGTGFNTLSRVEFAGSRALMVSMRHDFGRALFGGSGLPLLRKLPTTFSVHAGAFWTSLEGSVFAPADTMLTVARRPYTEAGFTIGNLTPFLAPFNFAASFTWQLSSYPTNRFRFGFGFSGP